MRAWWVCRAVPLGLALVFGCGLVDEFEVMLTEEATIPGTFAIGAPAPLDLSAFNGLQLNSNSSFSNNGVSPGDVDAIFVKSVELEITNPPRGNLGAILQSTRFFVEAPGLERTLVAEQTTFPAAAKASLIVEDRENIQPYATASEMSLAAEIVLRQQPALQTTVRATIILLVDVDLLGV